MKKKNEEVFAPPRSNTPAKGQVVPKKKKSRMPREAVSITSAQGMKYVDLLEA